MKWYHRFYDLYEKYDVFFCDIWGVIHKGYQINKSILKIFQEANFFGKHIFLITNSPRSFLEVSYQLETFGMLQSFYKGIVTSGDMTKNFLQKNYQKIFHIGSYGSIFNNTDIKCVEESKAEAIVCTGLFNDKNDTLQNYQSLLKRLYKNNLPFICANPDLVVQKGNSLFLCAGSLAKFYMEIGGKTIFFGKPEQLIYEKISQIAEKRLGTPINKKRTIAIGDSMFTDVQGAINYGIDVLFIGNGIHRHEYIVNNIIDRKKLNVFFQKNNIKPTAFMTNLK